MKQSLLLRAAAAAVLICALTLGCSGDDGGATGPRVPAAIVLVPNQPKVPQGLTVKLNATVVDATGRAIPGQTVTFESSDSTVVTVDATGLMHAVGPLGTARVTADLNGLTAFVDVEVTQRVVSLAVTPESLVINRGLYDFLQVSLKDFQGNDVYPVGVVTFTSADPTIVTVSSDGVVQALNKTGKTTVRVAVDTFHADVPVRVDQIPASIAPDPVNVVLQQGGTQQLTVVVRDLANQVIASPVLTFESSAPGSFSVSGTGLITALAPSGSGTVTIHAGNLQQQVGVYIGSAIPVTVTHTTQTGTALYEADIGPGGQLVVSAPDAARAFRGTLPGSTLPTTFITAGQPLGVAVNHAGTRAYVACAIGLCVEDLVNNTSLPTIEVLGGGTKIGVVVSADDQRAYLGTNVYIYVIDLVAGQAIDSLDVPGAFFMALHPTQPLLYAGEGQVREVDLNTRQVRTFAGAAVKELAVSPDGTEIYGADEGGGALRIFSIATGQLTQSVSVPGAFGLAASNKYIAVTTNTGVVIFDRQSRVKITSLTLGGFPRRPAINSAENTIVVPNEAGWLDYIQ